MDDDPLGAARGVMFALPVAVVFWCLVALAMYLANSE